MPLNSLAPSAVSFSSLLTLLVIDGCAVMLLGLSVIAHTLYLVECAPKRLRGMVGVTVAMFISLGKFCGQLMGIR